MFKHRGLSTARLTVDIAVFFPNMSSGSITFVEPVRKVAPGVYTMCVNLFRVYDIAVAWIESECTMASRFSSIDVVRVPGSTDADRFRVASVVFRH